MSKILLVPGFATEIWFSVFRHRRGATAGFNAFYREIASGEAKTFRWGISEDASFFQSLNPWYAYHIYRLERSRIENVTWQEKLMDAIRVNGVETVVCHSMGCAFLLRAIQRFGLPDAVKRVVLVQGDVDIEETLPAVSAQVENLYCPWDVSLVVSSIVHRRLRIGLVPWKQANVRNVFFPLLRLFNFHTATIRSPRFVRWLERADRVS